MPKARESLTAIAAITLGAMVAWILVPEHPTGRGELVLSGIAMIAGISFVPIISAIRHPRSILYGRNVLALSCIFWLLLDLVPGAYEMDLSQDVARRVFVAIAGFMIAAWAASLPKPWLLPGVVRRAALVDWGPITCFRIGLVAFSLAFLRYLIACDFDLAEFFKYLGAMRWDAPWAREQLGGWNAFVHHLSYFGYMLPMIAWLVARKSGLLNIRVLVLVACSVLIALPIAQGGGRRLVGVILGSALICWALSYEKFRVRQVIIGAVGIILLLSFLQIMLNYRNVGLGALFSKEASAATAKHERFRVDDNFLRLGQVIQFIPDDHPHVYWRYPLFVAIRPVPRVFWPNKPIDPGFDLAIFLGQPYVSYTSSVIGELWMAGGFLVVLLGGWIYGRIAAAVTKLVRPAMTSGGLVLYSAALMAIVAGVRSGLELVLMSYVILAWLALTWAAERIWAPQPASGIRTGDNG